MPNRKFEVIFDDPILDQFANPYRDMRDFRQFLVNAGHPAIYYNKIYNEMATNGLGDLVVKRGKDYLISHANFKKWHDAHVEAQS